MTNDHSHVPAGRRNARTQLVEQTFSTVIWAAHPKPQPDELFSSWLARVAWSNQVKLHTFCDLVWRNRAIWNRDIDKSATREVTERLARGTGTSTEVAWQTTLASYEGVVYTSHNSYGNCRWILPIGVFHRVRRRCGLQFCPRCLAQDARPYFRRAWRLAFTTVCVRHGEMLLDRCPKCGSAVCFHRREIGDRNGLPDGQMTVCFECNFDLRAAETTRIESKHGVFHRSLRDAVEKGWIVAPHGRPVYAHLYFDVLHQILKTCLSGRSRDFGRILSNASGFEFGDLDKERVFEHLSVADRHSLLALAAWAFEDWPNRFIELCQKEGIWSSWLLRDMHEVPFWFADAVRQRLYLKNGATDADHERKLRQFRRRQLRGD
jgi:hypothetical protein